MKFESIEEAKMILITSIIIEAKATEQGDVKTGNKYSDKIRSIISFINKDYKLGNLKDLLDHDNDKVRVWVAQALLPIYEDIALNVLEEISKKNISHCSFNARIISSEWKNEPLRFD